MFRILNIIIMELISIKYFLDDTLLYDTMCDISFSFNNSMSSTKISQTSNFLSGFIRTLTDFLCFVSYLRYSVSVSNLTFLYRPDLTIRF